MASCKLTSSLGANNCGYAVGGTERLYLFNYDPSIVYTFNEGSTTVLSKIELPAGSKAYKITPIDNSLTFETTLTENGNGGKFRTHTVNFILERYIDPILQQDQALSLGKLVAVVVDRNGNVIILGRKNGLKAATNDYASGGAIADANGWTVQITGGETEVPLLLKDETVISSIVDTGADTNNFTIVD